MAKNNKTRFPYVLYSDKTWAFDQSERAPGPINIMKLYNRCDQIQNLFKFPRFFINRNISCPLRFTNVSLVG